VAAVASAVPAAVVGLAVMGAEVDEAVVPGVEASSLPVSKQPVSLKLRHRYSPGSWRGSRAASAWRISTTGTRPSPALRLATGETSSLGASQHRTPWTAGAHH
jgi:hypothetical protein